MEDVAAHGRQRPAARDVVVQAFQADWAGGQLSLARGRSGGEVGGRRRCRSRCCFPTTTIPPEKFDGADGQEAADGSRF
jgi:hypothetical protein